MKPWEATARGRKPTDAELREHVEKGKSDGAIGQLFDVSRFTVAEWRKAATPPIEPARKRRTPVNHSQHVPWRLAPEHVHDPIARRLRLHSSLLQGADLKPEEVDLARRFAESVREADVVIAYTPERGFYRVRRDVTRDTDPNLLVRVPAS